MTSLIRNITNYIMYFIGASWFYGIVVSVLIFVAAWVTHVATCLTHGEWGFLIAGAIMFPIAIVHGIGIWFGFW